jgi:5-formyltetrahydrofolate cyclo-ligase
MVGPSPTPQETDVDSDAAGGKAADKAALRRDLRKLRRAHVEALDPRVKALLLNRPPSALAAMVPQGAVIGLYSATAAEAPASGYARFFHEAGHTLALPAFTSLTDPMAFRHWASPYVDDGVEVGPFGMTQPLASAETVTPDVVFVPLVGFTADGARLGQGGGHYDRWLEQHPHVRAIGLAWDCQLLDALPHEAHDRPLSAVVTPTRLYGPFGD